MKLLKSNLKEAQDYCNKILKALASVGGRTPVAPLRGLVCDYCKQPFILEGGKPALEAQEDLETSFVLKIISG